MKRMMAVVLVFIVIIANSAIAGASSGSDSAKEMMEYSDLEARKLIEIYEANPGEFDDNQVFRLYSYYALSRSLDGVYLAELNMEIRSDPITDTNKRLQASMFTVYEHVDNLYKQWLSGEITTKEFCEKAIPIIKVTVTEKEE